MEMDGPFFDERENTIPQKWILIQSYTKYVI